MKRTGNTNTTSLFSLQNDIMDYCPCARSKNVILASNGTPKTRPANCQSSPTACDTHYRPHPAYHSRQELSIPANGSTTSSLDQNTPSHREKELIRQNCIYSSSLPFLAA
mmetsp:Transcript_14148/g.22773  ORF Transcript_14148/g.22773 Transcript_14148/m.22773 type:complete len:110 (-) Transcript_14148:181-510(-)